MASKKCKICDSIWIVNSQNKNKKYCSIKCQHIGISKYKKIEKCCINESCTNKFVVNDIDTKKYCSHKCAMSDSSNWDIIRKQTTLNKYGTTTFNNTEKRKKTVLNKYGVDNVSKHPEIIKSAIKTRLQRYNCEFILMSVYYKNKMIEKYGKYHQNKNEDFYDSTIRKTQENNGVWTSRQIRTDWYRYKRNVLLITEQNWNKYGYIFNRGLYSNHLDHKFSILNGFNENIEPEIIGSFVNLEVLSANENQQKREKNSISKEDLIHKYTNSKQKGE